MRKKIAVLLLLGSVFLISPALHAFPFLEVEGFVNPYAATFTDLGNGTSKVTNLAYSFFVTSSALGAEMITLSLEFESDVFKSLTSAYNYNPSDWNDFSWTWNQSTYLLSVAGSPIAAGDTLSFLVDAIIYNAALYNPSLWQEGQVWGQSWVAFDSRFGGDGGSTAPVPEPTAMLLFGTGLAAFGFIGRRFKKN